MTWYDLGALFTPSEKTKLAGIESAATKYPDTGEQAFLDADHTKLNGIETGADVTDATNVNAAGAVMLSDATIAYDTITEKNDNAGVTIDGLVIKDSHIASVVHVLKAKVVFGDEGVGVSLGTLPIGAFIYNIKIFVDAEFTDTGTDLMNIGVPASHTYLVNQQDISTIGLEEPARLSSWCMYDTAAEFFAYYEGQNNDAAAGAALVFIEYLYHPGW